MRGEDNDEARMTNDETMTKSENRSTSADESFWYNDAESMVREEPAKPRVYDLEERTARLGEAVIDFVKQIPQDETDHCASKTLRHSSFVIPSCFGIRTSSFQPCPLTPPSSK